VQVGTAPRTFLKLLFMPDTDSITLKNSTSFGYDQIDKISERGYESLTKEEKQKLFNASKH
jgi:hypothetical protein